MRNKTFRLFVSSTFSDFISERTVLNEELFHSIEKYCAGLGYGFQLIDLRWGVNTESAISHNTIDICLNEVRRCRTFSPKPNFLVMVGERYGWIPLPPRIAKNLFERILSVGNESEIDLLKKWYKLDENKIGGEYTLFERRGEYIDDHRWAQEEALIRDTLIRLAKISGEDPEEWTPFTTSATEKEIIEGLFSAEGVCDNTIAFFRSGFPDCDEDLSNINSLKSRIEERMQNDDCSQNVVTLDYTEDDTYLEQFKEIIQSILLDNISREIERLQNVRSELSDIEVLEGMFAAKHFFHARLADLEQIRQLTESRKGRPIFVSGESGSGKTTLLAELIKTSNKDVFFGFFGLNMDSYNLVDVLNHICSSISTKYDTDMPLQLSYEDISSTFHDAVWSVPSDIGVLIVIDGLDMFQDLDRIHENVFPRRLPDNVSLIVSAANETILDRFREESYPVYTLTNMNSEQCITAVIEGLSMKGRSISNEHQMKQIKNVFSQGKSPLVIKLIEAIASKWRSFDSVKEFPETSWELVISYIEDMYLRQGHEKYLCLYSLALIAATPFGVTENELQYLLYRFDRVKEGFSKEDRYSYTSTRIPYVIWSRLFYDLQDCLSLIVSGGNVVVQFIHNIFRSAIRERHEEICDEAYAALIYYFITQPDYINDEGEPNVRKADLLPLLTESAENEDAALIYSSLPIMDIFVKTGKLDFLIDKMQNLIISGAYGEDTDFYTKILYCLQDNRESLRCYKDILAFLQYEYEFFPNENLLIRKELPDRDPAILHFQYPLTSRIIFEMSGTKLAVISKSYIIICNYPSMTEICRIYVEPKSGIKPVFVKKVIWADSFSVLVCTPKRIILYDFADLIPNVTMELNYDGGKVDFDTEEGFLIYRNEKKIHIFDLNTMSDRCMIEHERYYDIDCSLCEIYLLSKSKAITVVNYSSSSEETVQIKANFLFGLNPDYLKRIGGRNGNKWLVKNNGSYYIYGSDSGKKNLLAMPFSDSGKDTLYGSKYLIFRSNSYLASVDIENYDLKICFKDDITSIAWKERDQSIAAIGIQGLSIIELADFESLEGELSKCIVSKHQTNMDIGQTIEDLKLLAPSLVNYKKNQFESQYLDYDAMFSDHLEESAITNPVTGKASIIQFANDGSFAIAYEEDSVIRLFNSSRKELLRIDKLNLSIINGILRLLYSPDSKLFMIWRNYSIQVIDIEKGKCIATIDLTRRPAYFIFFNEDSTCVEILLCDGEIYSYDLKSHAFTGKQPPLEASPGTPNYKDSCTGPYSTINDKYGRWRVVNSISNADKALSPNKWFDDDRGYWSGENYLRYYAGIYYYNDLDERPFRNKFMDFKLSYMIERQKDSTNIAGFLREKNDIMSDLYENKTGSVMVLVSRGNNSVILFDVTENEIRYARKMHANIIGSLVTDEGDLEVYCNQVPYKTLFTLQL